jgi:hypothetical protein
MQKMYHRYIRLVPGLSAIEDQYVIDRIAGQPSVFRVPSLPIGLADKIEAAATREGLVVKQVVPNGLAPYAQHVAACKRRRRLYMMNMPTQQFKQVVGDKGLEEFIIGALREAGLDPADNCLYAGADEPQAAKLYQADTAGGLSDVLHGAKMAMSPLHIDWLTLPVLILCITGAKLIAACPPPAEGCDDEELPESAWREHKSEETARQVRMLLHDEEVLYVDTHHRHINTCKFVCTLQFSKPAGSEQAGHVAAHT